MALDIGGPTAGRVQPNMKPAQTAVQAAGQVGPATTNVGVQTYGLLSPRPPVNSGSKTKTNTWSENNQGGGSREDPDSIPVPVLSAPTSPPPNVGPRPTIDTVR